MTSNRWVNELIIASILLVSCFGCTQKKKVTFNEIKSISELSTMECSYHNVARTDINGISFFNIDITGKKVWEEYTSNVEIGIDMDKLNISSPDTNGEVTIEIPQAEILNVSIETGSYGKAIVRNSILNTVTIEEIALNVSKTQKDLENKVSQDTKLLEQARSRAKNIIQGYIENVGKQMGQEYNIKWVNLE